LDWARFANTCELNEQPFNHGLVLDSQRDNAYGSYNDPGRFRPNRTWPKEYSLNVFGVETLYFAGEP
jgi:hypothetical protein